eukprot:12522219-Ditylum_brightwellii.AAC.1
MSVRQKEQRNRVLPTGHLYNEILWSEDKLFIIQHQITGMVLPMWQIMEVNLDNTRLSEAQQLRQYCC